MGCRRALANTGTKTEVRLAKLNEAEMIVHAEAFIKRVRTRRENNKKLNTGPQLVH